MRLDLERAAQAIQAAMCPALLVSINLDMASASHRAFSDAIVQLRDKSRMEPMMLRVSATFRSYMPGYSRVSSTLVQQIISPRYVGVAQSAEAELGH